MREKLSEHLSLIMFGSALVIELALLASQWNHGRKPGHEVGPWGIEMPSGWSQFFSWTALILAGWAFVRLTVAVKAAVLGALLAVVALIELWFGRVLPPPQDNWVVVAAFMAGVLVTFFEAVRETNFVTNARDRLSHIRSH